MISIFYISKAAQIHEFRVLSMEGWQQALEDEEDKDRLIFSVFGSAIKVSSLLASLFNYPPLKIPRMDSNGKELEPYWLVMDSGWKAQDRKSYFGDLIESNNIMHSAIVSMTAKMHQKDKAVKDASELVGELARTTEKLNQQAIHLNNAEARIKHLEGKLNRVTINVIKERLIKAWAALRGEL